MFQLERCAFLFCTVHWYWIITVKLEMFGELMFMCLKH